MGKLTKERRLYIYTHTLVDQVCSKKHTRNDTGKLKEIKKKNKFAHKKKTSE